MASPQLQGYTKLNSMNPHSTKLNTTVLGHLNPHLTPEQKFSRTINHVEKWLNERDHQVGLNNKTKNDLRVMQFGGGDSDNKNKINIENFNNVRKDEQIIENLINTKVFVDKLKITEKFTEKLIETPKKTFNKEALLTKKLTAAATPSKQQRMTSATTVTTTPTSSNGNTSKNLSDSIRNKTPVTEYSSIPIIVDPSECENLLGAASSEESCQTPETASTVHRYVHEHIHHHYHHFEDAEEIL